MSQSYYKPMEKSNETKNNLLEAACHVFREKSYEKAKVSDIVTRANVAQGTFYLYFKSKNDCLNMLITELIQGFLDDIRHEFENLDNDSIYRVLDKIKTAIDEHSQILAIMHFEQLNMDEEVMELHRKVDVEGSKLIYTAFIHRGLSEKAADIKTRLIDAIIKRYLLDNVYIFSSAFKHAKEDIDEMIKIVVEEVDC